TTLDVACLVAIKTLTGLGLSCHPPPRRSSVACRMSRRQSATRRRALEQGARHLYIHGAEGDIGPRLWAGSAATEVAPFVLKSLNSCTGRNISTGCRRYGGGARVRSV